GIDLADAERLSQESRALVFRPAYKLGEVSDQANYLDTLAYIQMQKGKIREALNNWEIAIQIKQTETRYETIFRYALAQFVAGQRDKAIRNLVLSVDIGRYVPSHEMYLLRQHIRDEFLTNLESLMSKHLPTSAPASGTCSRRDLEGQ